MEFLRHKLEKKIWQTKNEYVSNIYQGKWMDLEHFTITEYFFAKK